jgi:hypothetical protein
MLTPQQTVKVLELVKGIWQDQAADPPTVAAWHDVLGALDYGDIVTAVGDRARSGSERPSAAQLYAESVRVRDRHLDGERARQKKLDYQPSAEDRAEGLAKLREISASIGKSKL